MNYDITFCSNKNCKQECKRNQNNVEKIEITTRYGIWIGDFPKCKYFNKKTTKVSNLEKLESEDK